MIKIFGCAALFALLLVAPATAAPVNWSGFYVGANAGAGYATGEFTDDCYFCATDSFDKFFATLGGQAGFNGQSGAVVYGLEGDIDWSSFSRKGVLGADDTSFLREKLDLSWMASIRARAGLAVDNALLYVTAGPVFGHVNAPGIEYCCGIGNSPTPDGTTFSESGTRAGMIGGVGMEMMIQNQWSVRGEYLYFDLGSETANIAPASDCSVNRQCTVQNTLSGQMVRIAVNYHFGE